MRLLRGQVDGSLNYGFHLWTVMNAVFWHERWIGKQQAASSDRMQRLDDLKQRLDDLEARISLALSQLTERLEQDLRIVASQISDHAGQLGRISERHEKDHRIFSDQLGQISERHERDLRIVANQIIDLASQIGGLSATFLRLDRNVGDGFGQIGRRLDTDTSHLGNRLDELWRTMSKELTELSVQCAKFFARIQRDARKGSAQFELLGATQEEVPLDLVDGVIRLNFPDCAREEFPLDFEKAWSATQAILDVLPESNLSPLADHSPGLTLGNSYEYVRLSVIRLARVGLALRRSGLTSGRILDFGSYYGNFSLFVRSLGFEVYAADTYGSYRGAFSKTLPLLHKAGVKVIDLTEKGRDLALFESDFFDAVLCMSVIEHVPHTPKPILLALNRVLRPGGTLVLDTPNLLYAYTRERLAEGKPIFTPIELQFNVEPPFEGHHREYTPSEVKYMLEAIGHEVTDFDIYNYSIYELKELAGQGAARFARMAIDPELRELIFTRSIKR
jgi:2-polyprenyl-3-methyl-5-hydroxy-6-metoxy-1,4-benzoquinol methylase